MKNSLNLFQTSIEEITGRIEAGLVKASAPSGKLRALQLLGYKGLCGYADNQWVNIRINGEPLDFELENEQTAGEVMAQLEKFCESNGMTITSVKSGGRTIAADELDSFFAGDIKAVEDLEIGAISGIQILEIAGETGKEFSQLSLTLQDIPVQLQTGRGRQAMDVIAELSGKLEKLCYLLPLLPLAGISEEALKIEEMRPEEYLASVFPFMEEITSAIEQQDTVTIGDISEYEIAPRMLEIGNFLLRITGGFGQNT